MSRQTAVMAVGTFMAALLALIPGTTAPAAGAEPSHATVTVTSAEFVYTDLTKSAHLSLAGREGVQPVDHVALGFNAYRSVDSGSQDRRFVQDASAHVSEQRVTILVDVIHRGDLQVAVAGRAANGLDPQPVAASAVPDATPTARGFLWEIPDAAPGVHRFEASIAPNASATAPARFVPEVVVERRSHDRAFARHLRGAVAAPSRVLRTDRLTLTQIHADAGAPDVEVPPLREAVPTPRSDPKAVGGEMLLRANGFRAPVAAERAERARLLRLSDHVGYEPALTLVTSGEEAVGGRKAEWGFRPRISTLWDYFLSAPGSPSAPQGGGTERPPAPLYEGDALQVGAIAMFTPTSTASRKGRPGPGGRLVTRRPAGVTDTFSYLTHNELVGFEPNRTDTEATLDESALWSADLTSAAALSFLVEGGDIDNRKGRTAIRGDDVVLPNPAGFTPVAAFATVASTGDELPVDFSLKLSTSGVTLTPMVEAGRYALRSRPGRSGVEDWATHVALVIFYAPVGGASRVSPPMIATRAPAGTTALTRVVGDVRLQHSSVESPERSSR